MRILPVALTIAQFLVYGFIWYEICEIYKMVSDLVYMLSSEDEDDPDSDNN